MTKYQEVLAQLNQTPQTWLITGVAGFIGSNLLETLLKNNQIVTGLDNFSTGFAHNLQQIQALVTPQQWQNFSFIEGDIRDLNTCKTACANSAYILHEAALGSVPRSIADPINTNDTNITGAEFGQNRDGTGHAALGSLETGGVRVDNVDANFGSTELGVTGNAHLGQFTNMDSVTGATANWDLANGTAAAHADHVGVGGLDITGASTNFAAGDVNMGGSLGHLGTGFNADNISTSASLATGLSASVGHASYSTVGGENLDLHTQFGSLASSSIHVGEGHFDTMSGDNLHASLNGSGASLGGDNLAYDYLGFRGVDARQSIGNGAIGEQIHLGQGSLLGGTAGHAELHSDGRTTDAAVTDLNAHGLTMTDASVSANVGSATGSVGADHIGVLDAHVGSATAHTGDFGLNGTAAVDGASVDALNIQHGHAALGVGGREVASATGSVKAGGGVGHADGTYDLTHGTASANVRDAHAGAQLSNASVGVLGHNIALPDAGYDVHASGGAAVDVRQGTASGHASLAGSSVNLAGHSVALGEWAQASGSVNARQGAASGNVGGANGVSGSVNLSQGQFDVGVGGYHVNNQTVANGWNAATGAVGSMASSAMSALTGW